MTFQERIKALPEAERLTFFRSILAISEAGRKGGEKPEAWGKYVAELLNELGRLSKEEKSNV
jgi:hypothetical protein